MYIVYISPIIYETYKICTWKSLSVNFKGWYKEKPFLLLISSASAFFPLWAYLISKMIDLFITDIGINHDENNRTFFIPKQAFLSPYLIQGIALSPENEKNKYVKCVLQPSCFYHLYIVKFSFCTEKFTYKLYLAVPLLKVKFLIFN